MKAIQRGTTLRPNDKQSFFLRECDTRNTEGLYITGAPSRYHKVSGPASQEQEKLFELTMAICLLYIIIIIFILILVIFCLANSNIPNGFFTKIYDMPN